uniref:Ionotropic receptor n=1 Tax=Stomoxys calcitrans TaxID=35570 RepID=A0A2Y9D4J9_STOCA
MKFLYNIFLYFLVAANTQAIVKGQVERQPYQIPLPSKVNDQLGLRYASLIMDIYQEQKFDSILLFQQSATNSGTFENLYLPSLPKVIISSHGSFCFKDFYNSEILVIFTLHSGLDWELMERAAYVLNYMRQTRILMLAENIQQEELLIAQLLKVFELYKMTNVFLTLAQFQEDEERTSKYLMLYPYPEYQWRNWLAAQSPYYTEHWRNFGNKSLKTFVEVTSSRAFIFKDSQGNFKFSGYVANMILLFAQLYNASLSMLDPQNPGNKSHYLVVNEMVENQLLDFAMGLTPLYQISPRNTSDAYEVNEVLMMIPLAKQLTMQELYAALLSGQFFASLLMATLVFSMVHSIMEYLQYGLWHRLDLMISNRILPGILGLSFPCRSRPRTSLKMVYMLLGFFGLYITTLFAANNKSLFTRPPLHADIRTFDDLSRSSLKYLTSQQDFNELKEFLEPIRKSVQVIDNRTIVVEHRTKLNTSYAYSITTTSFDILWRKQKFSCYFTFHTPSAMVIHPLMPWCYNLQYNSPYKEALNYLMHRIHAAGLEHIWRSQVFYDQLRSKEIHLSKPPNSRGVEVLGFMHLFGIWMIAIVGFTSSTIVFIIELWMGRHR